ncbi:DUF4157 domain-containing protein, partial [bacterium]|nr:DUF4157 domain-containing protein [bacterium]
MTRRHNHYLYHINPLPSTNPDAMQPESSLRSQPIRSGSLTLPVQMQGTAGGLEAVSSVIQGTFICRPLRPPMPDFTYYGLPEVHHVQAKAGHLSAFPLQALPPRGPGQPLPDEVKTKMEIALGADFSNVRVHVGQQAPSIGALAYTRGSDIYFAPGQYNPQTYYGQQFLGHELTHVLQQRAGRVRNPFGFGVAVVQDLGLEAEHEHMGMRTAVYSKQVLAKIEAVAERGPIHNLPNTRPGDRSPGAIQRSAPVHISAPASVGRGSYRIVAGAAGHQVGSVMVHDRGDAAIEVTDLGVNRNHRKHGVGGDL